MRSGALADATLERPSEQRATQQPAAEAQRGGSPSFYLLD